MHPAKKMPVRPQPSTRQAPMPIFRLATSTDNAQIQRICAACVSTAEWLPVPARHATDFATVSTGEVITVATDDSDQVLCFISVHTDDRFIHHLYIDTEARGCGIGRLLLASLETWLPTPWHLKCVSANHQALAFYMAQGWREVGQGASEHGAWVALVWQPLAAA